MEENLSKSFEDMHIESEDIQSEHKEQLVENNLHEQEIINGFRKMEIEENKDEFTFTKEEAENISFCNNKDVKDGKFEIRTRNDFNEIADNMKDHVKELNFSEIMEDFYLGRDFLVKIAKYFTELELVILPDGGVLNQETIKKYRNLLPENQVEENSEYIDTEFGRMKIEKDKPKKTRKIAKKLVFPPLPRTAPRPTWTKERVAQVRNMR